MTNTHITANGFQNIAQIRAERKTKAEAELTQLTELAEKVLQYGSILTMVDKLQTPEQRRAHEPITQSKRWSATCKIAGMTQTEFEVKFQVGEDTMFNIYDLSVWHYTRKQALASHAEACSEEFVRLMTVLRWQKPDIFAQILAYLKDING